jgi:hypothetical protein
MSKSEDRGLTMRDLRKRFGSDLMVARHIHKMIGEICESVYDAECADCVIDDNANLIDVRPNPQVHSG